jgi:hypothetical protein
MKVSPRFFKSCHFELKVCGRWTHVGRRIEFCAICFVISIEPPRECLRLQPRAMSSSTLGSDIIRKIPSAEQKKKARMSDLLTAPRARMRPL